MCLSAILGAGTALIGASSANKASSAQKQAAQDQTALQSRIYDETVQRFDPFYNSGLTAQNALAYELGLGAAPTIGGSPLSIETITTPGTYTENQFPAEDDQANRNARWAQYGGGGSYGEPTTQYRVGGRTFATLADAQAYANANATGGTQYGGYEATPGYQFQLDQGIGAIDASAASRGGLFSGATMQAAQTYGQGLANQNYGEYLNRLTGQATSGQAAAGNQAAAGQNYATGASNALANYGNAAAAGAIGVGNALNAGINNGLGIWQYQNALAQPSTPTTWWNG